jgi:hypothetical protein
MSYGFLFGLETVEGEPADPPTLTSAEFVQEGDTLPLGRGMLRVLRVRDDDCDEPPVLVVEELT